MSQDSAELRYLTGLRGYAALGVFCVHVLAQTSIPLFPAPIATFFGAGRHGVMAFFVLSAFTICLSISREEKFSGPSYAIRRFFRIAPLYYFLLILIKLVGGDSTWAGAMHTPYDLQSLFYHLTFLNVFDYHHANNAIGVEWTLPIEMLFYLFLPLMFWVSKSALGCVLLIASALAALFIPPWVLGAGTGPSSESWVWSPIPFYLAFAVGVVTLRASQVMGERTGFIPSAVVLAVFLIAIAFHPAISFEQNIVLYSVLTAALILAAPSALGRMLLENRAAYKLGIYSYSLYLIHMPIHDMAGHFFGTAYFTPIVGAVCTVIFTTAITFGLCLLTYKYLEVPGRRIGRVLANRVSESKKMN